MNLPAHLNPVFPALVHRIFNLLANPNANNMKMIIIPLQNNQSRVPVVVVTVNSAIITIPIGSIACIGKLYFHPMNANIATNIIDVNIISPNEIVKIQFAMSKKLGVVVGVKHSHMVYQPGLYPPLTKAANMLPM